MSLRWFLDSADTKSWREWMPAGLFFGITSNPLLLERAGEPCAVDNVRRLAGLAFELGAREFHAQTWGRSAAAMIETGLALAELDSRVVVKVPITREGSAAASHLIAKNVPVTMTALYAVHQVASAVALGAAYAAPYLGRIDEAGQDGHAVVGAMQRLIQLANSPMRLLVASVRRVESLPRLIEQGVDTFTLAPALLPDLFNDEATLAAAREFERAARSRRARRIER